jgi:hypothetical protein
LSFDWAEYLSVAEGYHGSPVSGPAAGAAAFGRSAVSRAYYAAFGVARQYLREVQRVSFAPAAAVHTLVWRLLAASDDEELRRIGFALDLLRRARNQCDYDDEVTGLERLALTSLRDARDIIRTLRRR